MKYVAMIGFVLALAAMLTSTNLAVVLLAALAVAATGIGIGFGVMPNMRRKHRK